MQNTNRKRYTAVLTNSRVFILLVFFNIFGSWGDSAVEYPNTLAKRSRDIEGRCNEAEFCCYWRKRFSVLLQKSNASFILHKLSRLLSTAEKRFMLDSVIQGTVH